MKNTCVIFDVDGTLFDTGEGIRDCARHALQQLGANFPDEKLDLFIGPSLFYSFHNTVGLSEEQAHRGVELYRARYQSAGIEMSRPYAGILDTLEKLWQEGYTLSIASSKPLVMVVAATFATVSSDKTAYVQSASLCERNVMVGDTRFDIEGAHNAGVPVIAAAYGFGAKETLTAAEYTANSPQEVYAAVKRHFA